MSSISKLIVNKRSKKGQNVEILVAPLRTLGRNAWVMTLLKVEKKGTKNNVEQKILFLLSLD